jgi:flagellar motor switch protein FliN/FliY
MADQTPQPQNAAEQSAATGDAQKASLEQMAVEAIETAVQAAQDISAQANDASGKPLDLPDFGANGTSTAAAVGMGLLDDVTLRVKVELGRTQIYIEDVLRLNANSVVELDKAAGDPVDIYVNERHVARGEVLVLNENFCVRISEIIQPAVDG